MERQAITVRGVVQGVGFRPFVYRLAARLQLNGFTRNRAGSLLIEVEGDRQSLDRFLDELQSHPPPLSRIDEVSRQPRPLRGEKRFRIEPSDEDARSQIFISPDVATCNDCLAELFDPADRRYCYAMLNCTNCGPRLSIIQGAPYDRQRTTMARFEMCAACQAEYDDPGNRRFHAQPTACPECGPQLEAVKPNGERIETNDPLVFFVDCLQAGKIGALKGLGGYHLVCDARDNRAVSALRRRKHRDQKPFAVMFQEVESVTTHCELGLRERALLESYRRPIVLLRKRASSHLGAPGESPRQNPSSVICEAVAPANPFLGVMLPYTPLHHLLMATAGGMPLVMTSGNRSEEPIAYLDDEAVERLGDIADVFLRHDRPIHVRCDDSVTRVVDGDELPVRRSRGYAPHPIKLPLECPCPMLAVGGQFKNVFALGHKRQAFLSHHMGDLDHFDAYQAFERDILLYEQLFDTRPDVFIHDLHPDYASTDYALRRRSGKADPSPFSTPFSTLAVQHHHAHMASCMAEHGLDEPVIGVTFDGTGLGTDETIWGGEFLVGDYSQFLRAAHLRCVRMPGGDRAIHEPWRMAVSHLLDAGCDPAFLRDVAYAEQRTVQQMIRRGFNSPRTSSAGRLFDAVAAIASVRARAGYEGQAAMELEWLATNVIEDGSYPFEFENENHATQLHDYGVRRPSEAIEKNWLSVPATAWEGQRTPFCIDTRPLIRALAQDVSHHVSADLIARRFHSTLVEIIATACDRIRLETRIGAVVISGGVFMNALLTQEVCTRLTSAGFRTYRHRLVPPGDGGLSLGQLAIAARTVTRAIGAPQFEQRNTQQLALDNGDIRCALGFPVRSLKPTKNTTC